VTPGPSRATLSGMRSGSGKRRMRRRRRSRREGAALILVVVVVAALLAIAAPFVASMRLHERTARAFAGRSRARLLAQAKRSQALEHLLRSHPDEERRLREATGTDRSADGEGMDDLEELTPPPTVPTGLSALQLDSGTGGLAEVEVDDARGRIDLNCSGPDPIANLLGVTVTTALLSYDEEKVCYVDDITPFYSDGDDKTVDGFVKIGQEYIAYRDTGYLPPAKGGEPDRPALLGLVRGVYFSRDPPPDERKARDEYHGRGSLVQDGRGYKIAFDALWRWLDTDRHGDLARFDSPAALRRIADWEFGRLRAAMVLERYGVTLARLRGWGIQREQAEEAGLDVSRLDDDAARKSETKEQRETREKAERTIRTAGLSVDVLRRFGGDAAVVRMAATLEAMDDAQREKVVAQWRERQEQVEAQALKLDGWMKDEMKRQLRDLTELRDQAPHLETIGRIELEEKVRPFMTTDAPPSAEAWSDPQPINQRVQYQPLQFAARLRPQDTRRFAAGMIARAQGLAGTAPEFRYVVGVTARDQVLLFPQLDRDYEAHTLELSCRVPTPVNVNTARSAVMAAILTGLQSRVGQRAVAGDAPDIVTPREARAIAARIIDERPASHLELRALLLELRQEEAITDQDVDAVYRNGIDPGDAMLLRSTVPFCYASGDVYELQAAGIVSDPAGNEVARYRTRETVRVAPPRDLVWTIDSQADFQDRVWIGGPLAQGIKPDPRDKGVASLFLPHAASNLTQTRPSYLGPYSARQWIFPSRSHAPGEGSLEPLPTHEPETAGGANEPPGGTSVGRLGPEGAFDFDDQLDGIELRALGGGTILNTALPHRHEALESGPASFFTSLGPMQLRGWVRLDRIPGRGQRGYLLDGGRAHGVDHISLFIEDGELVLRADDEALDLRESGGAGRANELRYRPNPAFTPGNWYHISIWVKGADRTDLAMAVDGRLVGRETLGSRLTRPLDAWATAITVEDGSSFPPSGWVRIGANRRQQGTNDRGVGGTDRDAPPNVCEVVHYSSKTGNTLNLDTGSNRINDTVQILVANGYALVGRPTPDPGNTVPASGRLPERGSGRLYNLVFSRAGQPNRTIQVAMGYPHEEGTLVVPYGYLGRLKNDPAGATPSYQERLRVGGATLVEPLPIYTPSTLLYAPVPGYTRAAWNASLLPNGPPFDVYPQLIDALVTVIPTLWAAPYPDAAVTARPVPPPPPPPPGTQPITDNPPSTLAGLPNVVGGWPSVGVVRITSRKQPAPGFLGPFPASVERILYRGISPDGRLLNCIRGFEGTTPAPHYLWDSIVLESIVVSDPTDYTDRATLADPRVLVSLDHPDGAEWLSVQKPTNPIALQAGLLLLPKRDSLLAELALPPPLPGIQIDSDHFHYASQRPSPPSTAVGQRRPEADLLDQMLDGNGTLGPTPGLVVVRSAHAVNAGQPYKEVLKRWDDNWSRVAKGTSRPLAAHPPGGKVVPTFIVRPIDAAESGRDDIVTVTDDGAGPPEREERRITHGATAVSVQQGINQLPGPLRALASDGLASRRDLTEWRDPAQGWLVAFDDFVSREYTGAANARIARWPTGNITQIPTSLAAGRARAPSGPGDSSPFAPGTLDARFDDGLLRQLDESGGPLPIDASAAQGTIAGNPRQLRQGKLLRVDDEVVATVDARPGQPPSGQQGAWSDATLLRGALGTTAQAHSSETWGWFLDWPAIAIADGPIGGYRGQAIPTRRAQGDFREHFGYVAVDRGGGLPWTGVLPFAERKNDHLLRHVDSLDRGTFTHAFGSDQTNTQQNDLLVDLPFRAHDAYAARTSSVRGVYFQAARELPGGYVTHVDWDENLPSAFAECLVAVRVDGAPGWDADPTTIPGQPGRLYLFDDPKAPNQVLLRATRVEVRVYLTFKPGALVRDGWKRPAVLGALRVHYRQPSAQLRFEERTE
jgi:hypothetical protein